MTTDQNRTPEPIEGSDAALDAEPVLSRRALHRIGWVVVAILLLILLTVLPPLLNVNRYQRRVAQAISDSIGRPVHFDQIHLHLLPLPGLTIQNFVIQEDPAFGTEPALRANTVEARLRLASLWRRRVEVSHITLQAPSINLVRRADGRWNLQGVVTEAGHLQNAPTAQGKAGPAPRFPYIEASDARINIKAGETKLPWSLLDAKLALWLPDQNEWRVRLRGRPLRTDTDVSDVGELELESSLGRAPSGVSSGVLDQPLAISARWASTPLGEAAKLFLGRDTGFRGAASAELEIRGTPAHMQMSSDVHLHNLRRSEFVPRLPMSLDAHCQADAMGIIHALQHIRCAIPTTSESSGLFQDVFRSRDAQLAAAPNVLFLRAEIPDLLNLSSATATLDLKNAQPDYFLNWLRVFSSRIPDIASASGEVTLHTDWNSTTTPEDWNLEATCHCKFYPDFTPRSLESKAADVPAPDREAQTWNLNISRIGTSMPDATRGQLKGDRSLMVSLARQPPSEKAHPVLDGSMDPDTVVHGSIDISGAQVQYASYDLARYVASLIPPLGDGMPAGETTLSASRSPVEADRSWNGPQQWSEVPITAPQPVRRKRRR